MELISTILFKLKIRIFDMDNNNSNTVPHGVLVSPNNPPREHSVIIAFVETDNEYKVECVCGAKWTHGKDATKSYMESIFDSHVKYFNNKTMVL